MTIGRINLVCFARYEWPGTHFPRMSKVCALDISVHSERKLMDSGKSQTPIKRQMQLAAGKMRSDLSKVCQLNFKVGGIHDLLI